MSTQPGFSRVSSTVRMNNMTSPSIAMSPETPTINTAANISASSSVVNLQMSSYIDSSNKKYEDLELFKELNSFEKNLSAIAESITNYKEPNIRDFKNLNKNLDTINHQLNDVEIYLKLAKHKNLKLNRSNRLLKENFLKILLELNEYRKTLSQLPNLNVSEENLENEEQDNENGVKTEDLLQYALKLSKFSKIPPSFDLNSINPRNFIWPGEDSLRRGVLAMASLKQDELIKVGDEDKLVEEKPMEGIVEGQDHESEASDEEFLNQRRSSFNYENRGDIEAPKNEIHENAVTDLDLFDSDDDDT
ncbi:hypothetical protein PACTADRAFT_35218 [Pachysolen tannophilus NRRL Y-2460]|uniref:Mediator of RNA polymerase II transcription subunit 4 n=1 Tax=Pachysolen tannophilus NRRL Y-2460 TaxID=669874 RepID=A0A1E4TRR1_PACTA|nr:hypothetical protein PACTADRAFT_35218 [Pachysolen tannophilus NRRL Y-2460]